MFEQKAIAIPTDWGMQAFADALERILNQLAAEGWNSRMFQFGPSGVLVLAHRTRFTNLLDAPVPEPEELLHGQVNAFDDDHGDDVSSGFMPDPRRELQSLTRQMLDRIFDLVGAASVSEALEAIPTATNWVAEMYPYRSLNEAFGELQGHYRRILRAHDASDETTEYAQIIAAVLNGMRHAIACRVN